MPDDPNTPVPPAGAPPEGGMPADGTVDNRPPAVDADTIDAWMTKVIQQNNSQQDQPNFENAGYDPSDDSHLGD